VRRLQLPDVRAFLLSDSPLSPVVLWARLSMPIPFLNEVLRDFDLWAREAFRRHGFQISLWIFFPSSMVTSFT